MKERIMDGVLRKRVEGHKEYLKDLIRKNDRCPDCGLLKEHGHLGKCRIERMIQDDQA